MVRIDVVKQSFPLKKDKDLLSKTGNIKPSNSNNNPYATLPLNAFKTNIVSIKNISFKGFSTQDADNAYNIASYNITRGRFNEAEKLLNKALTAYLQKGDDNASLKTLNKLTMVKIRQGKYQDAQKYIEKADKFAKEPVNIHTADLYRNKGFLAAINNDSSKAKSWLSHAINIYDSLGEKAKLNKAEALCYVGVLHSTNEDVMDIPKAGKAFSESISIYEELDPENDGLPYALYHMAAMTLNNGNLDLANILMNRVKKLYQKEENNHGLAEALYTLGMIDYQQGMSLNEKGLYYYQKSHFESADKNLEQAASIRKMVVGNNSPRVADILNVQALANAQIGFNNMGGLLYNIKSLKKAEKLFKEAINIYSNIEDIEELKSNQLSLANTLVNYAQFKYRWNRDGVDAIPMMKIALKIYNAQKGPESEESKMVINAVQRMIPKSWGEKIVKEQNELIKHPEKIDKTPVVVEF